MTPKFEGIDVSKHQGTINWASLAQDPNVKFVIIRAGYGSYYPSQVDAQFETNYKKAKEYNIPVGTYWYSYATSVTEVRQEIAAFLKTIEGKQFEFPVCFDQEYESGIVALTNAQRTEIVKEALGTLEGKGYYAALYCSADWLNNRLNYSSLASYDMWIAQYGSSCASKLPYGMWQYSSKGSVSGISGNVDLDHAYKDYPTIIKNAGLNGFTKSADTSSSTPSTPTTTTTSTDYVLEWPLQGTHTITAGYYYDDKTYHGAIDLRVEYRQPVYAAKSGKVNFTYTWNGKVTQGDTNSYGNCIKILHDERYNGKTVETLYAHLDSYTVKTGQQVNTGDLIGYAGYTGNVSPAGINGKHLHFEVRYNSANSTKSGRTNPLVWLDNDFVTKSTATYTFASGERSAIRSTTSGTTSNPTTSEKKTITLKNGRWYIRKGPGTNYGTVTVLKSPDTNNQPIQLEYTTIEDGWYKVAQGYIGPAAISSHT